jgi:predicted metal-dependent phosphoesterase TrpH
MSEAAIYPVTVALHVHTLYSACSETKLEQIEDYCLENGIDAVGITDHDSIAGALMLQTMTRKLRIIIGEEIKTNQGEIVGLFLKQAIEPNLDPLETCQRIKEQGGLVYVPHPFDPFKIHRLKKQALMEVLDMVDIIEVFNAKSNFPSFDKVALRFAERHGKVAAAGSDAHYLDAIDLCANRIGDFSTPQEFLHNLKNANLVTRRGSPLRTWWVGIKNVLRGEGHHLKRYR